MQISLAQKMADFIFLFLFFDIRGDDLKDYSDLGILKILC